MQSTNVVPFRGAKNRPDSETFRRSQIFDQFYMRVAPGACPNPATYLVLGQLLSRTVGWGKKSCRLTLERFLDGDDHYAGIGTLVSRRSLYSALAELEGMGLLSRTRRKNHVELTLDENRIAEMVNVAVPKRFKTGAEPSKIDREGWPEEAPGSAPDALGKCTPCTSLREKITDKTKEGSHLTTFDGGPDPVDTVREIIRKQTDNTASRLREKAQAKPGKISAANIHATWKAALAESYPKEYARPWTKKQMGMAKAWFHGWDAPELLEFVDWSVRNWTAVCNVRFSKLKTPAPAAPEFYFFSQPWVREAFAAAWTQRNKQAWLTHPERTELERMMGRGMSESEALAQIAQRRAVAQMREENRKTEEKAARDRAIAERKLKAAEVAGAVPIHPRSPAARAMRQQTPDATVAKSEETPMLSVPSAPDREDLA